MIQSQKSEYLKLPEEDVDKLSTYSEGHADLLDHVEVLVRHRGLIALLGFLGAVGGCLLSLVESPVYRAETVILPVERKEFLEFDGRRSVANRSFHQEILQSPSTHRRVFAKEFSYQENGRNITTNLGTFLQIGSVQEGIEYLADAVSVEADRSGVITVSIDAESPGLAAAVANEYAVQLSQYYHRRRATQSREQLDFIQARIVDIRAELQASQNALVEFRRRNLDAVDALTAGSSGATSERALHYEHLSRDVERRSDLLATVMSRYEAAKVAAKGESARFEVLSAAEPADDGSRTAITTLAGIGLAVGLLVAISISFIRHYILCQSAAGRLDPILYELRTDKVRVQRLIRWLRPRTKQVQAVTEEEAASAAHV